MHILHTFEADSNMFKVVKKTSYKTTLWKYKYIFQIPSGKWTDKGWERIGTTKTSESWSSKHSDQNGVGVWTPRPIATLLHGVQKTAFAWRMCWRRCRIWVFVVLYIRRHCVVIYTGLVSDLQHAGCGCQPGQGLLRLPRPGGTIWRRKISTQGNEANCPKKSELCPWKLAF